MEKVHTAHSGEAYGGNMCEMKKHSRRGRWRPRKGLSNLLESFSSRKHSPSSPKNLPGFHTTSTLRTKLPMGNTQNSFQTTTFKSGLLGVKLRVQSEWALSPKHCCGSVYFSVPSSRIQEHSDQLCRGPSQDSNLCGISPLSRKGPPPASSFQAASAF